LYLKITFFVCEQSLTPQGYYTICAANSQHKSKFYIPKDFLFSIDNDQVSFIKYFCFVWIIIKLFSFKKDLANLLRDLMEKLCSIGFLLCHILARNDLVGRDPED
jgi:hypothetical protein